jgi:hypothetical protein
MNDRSSFGPQRGSGMLERHLYTRTSTSECTYWGNKGHTGVVLVSRCDRLSSVILSPHFLQTTLAYTPDLERLAV